MESVQIYVKRWNILWQALVSLKQALLHSEEGFYENLLFKQTKDRSKALCLLASACVPYKMFCKQHLSLYIYADRQKDNNTLVS